MRLVLVTWRDAWADSDQSKPIDWDAECIVKTVGWEVPCPAQHEGCNSLHLASERFPTSKHYYRSVTHIPREMVKSTKEL